MKITSELNIQNCKERLGSLIENRSQRTHTDLSPMVIRKPYSGYIRENNFMIQIRSKTLMIPALFGTLESVNEKCIISGQFRTLWWHYIAFIPVIPFLYEFLKGFRGQPSVIEVKYFIPFLAVSIIIFIVRYVWTAKLKKKLLKDVSSAIRTE